VNADVVHDASVNTLADWSTEDTGRQEMFHFCTWKGESLHSQFGWLAYSKYTKVQSGQWN